MKISISLPDDLADKAKKYCDRNGYKLSTLLQHLLQVKMLGQEDLGGTGEFKQEYPRTPKEAFGAEPTFTMDR